MDSVKSDTDKMYVCEICNYKTPRLYDYNRHNSSYKHMQNKEEVVDEVDEDGMYSCVCNKKYKHNSGLTRHRNSCRMYLSYKDENMSCKWIDNILQLHRTQIELQTNQTMQTQYIIERMDRQDEMIHQTMESRNVMNVEVQNNHFCLNIFLNDTCKNAMYLDEFVDSIEVGLEDIERMEELDYASGISTLIINKLNQATIVGRPLHCTDSKREIMYIKINANWQKADEELKLRFIQAIKKIAHKNIQAINLWIQKNPNWNDPRSKMNDRYLKIVSNSMSGATEEEQRMNMDKIVKNIIREVKINKNSFSK